MVRLNKILPLITIIGCLSVASSVWAKFSVEPVRVEIFQQAGTTQTGAYSIKNFDDTPIRIELEWFDKTINPAIETWFEFENNVVDVPPNSTVDIKYTISLPEDAQGLYYARVRFSENPPEGVAVGISKRYNYPLLVVAQGTQHYDYTINDIKIKNTDVKATTLEVFITNNSNTFFRPGGQIKIHPEDGSETEYHIEFNTERELILPQQGSLCIGSFIGDMVLPDGLYKAVILIVNTDEYDEKIWKKTMTFSVENGVPNIIE
ncbi:MAG: hypothetical protein RBU23_02575 [Candidatus Auribacterota bacterium]|jgi:hypothetical protein|nr:hypothetical protein [Candidatus Auribacterota bacterium]